MTSVRVFAIVAIVGVLVLGISACRPGRGPAKLLDECVHDAQCLEGLFCCDDTCHECCEDYDCDEDAGERCSDEHRCVKVGEPPPPAVAPAPLGADCERVRCQEGLHCCDDAKCHECCYPIHCDKGEDCQEYKCVPWENYPFPPPAGSLGSGCDTDPDCQEGLHCCDDAKCHKCCYDPHCAQNEDCVDYKCVPVPKPESEPASEQEQPPYELERVECSDDEDCPEGQKCIDGKCVPPESPPAPQSEEQPPPPEPAEAETEHALLHMLGEFHGKYNAAVGSEDVDGLMDLVFPPAFLIYGGPQCRANFEAGIQNTPLIINILDWKGPESWTWERDAFSVPIDGVLEVTVGLAGDRQDKIHLAQYQNAEMDNVLGFLPDCGDVLRAPMLPAYCDEGGPDCECLQGVCVEAEPGCTKDADCDEGLECVPGGYCADTKGPDIFDPYPPDDYMGHCCTGPNCEGYPTDIPYSVTVSDRSGVGPVELWWKPLGAGEPEQKAGDFVRGEGNEFHFTFYPPDWVGPGLYPYSIHAADIHGNTSSSEGWTLGLFVP